MSAQTHERPDMLVETDWLEKYMDDPQLRIVDMGPVDGFKRCHIPGAIGLNRDYLKDPDNDLFVMQPEQFEKMMGKVGIGNEHNVVAYDDYGGLYAARLWWALRTFGHDKVWVLNGGWNKWMREGRAWTQIAVTGYHSRDFNPHPPATFKARADYSMLCSAENIMERLNDPDFVTLDVRGDGEYDGTNLRGMNRRGGHMPNTVHIEWSKAVTDDDLRTFRPPDELRALYASAGVTPEKQVATY